ncbi:hypothetical protein ABBQ38_010667 [Trebouxia sp. C0009 RCD-2024]
MSNVSTPTSATADDKAKRVRDLLSSYYGNQPASGSGTGSPEAVTPSRGKGFGGSRGSGLDSAAFDADRYLSQLLRGTRLDGLLSKHVEMSTEIKVLDSDMQMLVYENYNKFISATDTIRSMKSNVDGMDGNMHQLKTVIDSVATRSNAVNSKLQLRRDHVEELNQVRGLLFKLQAIFDLPKRLHTALEQGAVEIAVNAFADAAPLLKRYGHKGAFRQVAVEADACAKELTLILKQRMVTQKDEAAECIQMVRKLGEPIESLQEDFLLCMHKRMEDILQEAEAIADLMAPAANPAALQGLLSKVSARGSWGFEGDTPPPLQRFAVELDQRFITELAHTAALFSELFEPSGRKKLLKVTREAFARYMRVIKRALTDAAAKESSRAAGVPAQPSEDPPASPSDQTPGFSGEWGAAGISDALYTISNDMQRIQSLLPELSPQDRGTEVVESTVRQHIGACFLALEQRVLATLSDASHQLATGAAPGGSPPDKLLQQAFSSSSSLIMQGSASILSGLQVYQAKQWVLHSWRDVFVDLVQGQLQFLFLSLLAGFVRMSGVQMAGSEAPKAGPSSAGASASMNPLFPTAGPSGRSAFNAAGAASQATQPGSPKRAQQTGNQEVVPSGRTIPPPGLLLLLAQLCSFMENTAVLHVMEIIAATFPGQGGGSGGDQPPAFVAGEVARRLGTAAQTLLGGYVEAHGRRMTVAVRRSVDSTNWLQHKEPRGPRPVCDLLLEKLTSAESEVVQLIQDTGQAAGRDARGNRSAASISGQTEGYGGGDSWGAQTPRTQLSGSAMERNVARLFRDRVKLTAAVEFTQASILAGISRVGLKSLVESVRLQTLSRAGLQQLQLDVHYLRPLLRRFAQGSEANGIHQLLDEVLSTALERALEPQLLEGMVLENIMKAYHNKA